MIGSVIWFAVVAIIIVNAVGKSKRTQKQGSPRRLQGNTAGTYQANPSGANAQQPNVYQPSAVQSRQQSNVYQSPAASQQPGASQPAAQGRTQQRVVTDADRAKLEAYRRKKAGSNAYVPSKPAQSSQNLNANRQRNASQPNIVERAKANSQRYAASDETLSELEKQHGHSERVSSAVAGYVEKEREEHRRMHEEPAPGVEETSLLGSVEDLMVKGYSGSLNFERDFIGEAAEMLAAFTMSE